MADKPEQSEAVVTAEETESKKHVVKEDGTVDINVDEVEAPQDKVEDPATKVTESTQPKYVTQDEFQKLHNSIAYQTRMVEKALKTPQAQPSEAPAPTGREPNAIDKVAEKDWQEGVRMVIQDEYKTIAAKQKVDSDKLALEQSNQQVMARNQNYVVSQYPDLNDEKSDATKRYLAACSELSGVDSNFYGNPYGPIAAMRSMEESMRKDGIVLPGVKEQADTEITRRNRAGIVSQVQARPVASQGKYTLSNEQRTFCDTNKIPYDQYAVSASKLEKGESLET